MNKFNVHLSFSNHRKTLHQGEETEKIGGVCEIRVILHRNIPRSNRFYFNWIYLSNNSLTFNKCLNNKEPFDQIHSLHSFSAQIIDKHQQNGDGEKTNFFHLNWLSK